MKMKPYPSLKSILAEFFPLHRTLAPVRTEVLPQNMKALRADERVR
jgi:hypothetical protein